MSDRIAPGSTLIRNTLNARLDAVEAGVTTHELLQLSASEFDDVRLHPERGWTESGRSIGGPAGVLPAGAQEVAAGAYSQYAKVRATRRPGTTPIPAHARRANDNARCCWMETGPRAARVAAGSSHPHPGRQHPRPHPAGSPAPHHPAKESTRPPPPLLPLTLPSPSPFPSTPLPAGALPPQGDYDLSLAIDLSSIPKERAARVAVVEHLASLRCVVYGTTLRNHFAALAAGTCADGPLVAVAHGHERDAPQTATRTNRRRVPHAIEDASDAVVAQTFLAMFNEAKRQPALSTAPTCSYAKPGSPPMELSEGGVVGENRSPQTEGSCPSCSSGATSRAISSRRRCGTC